MDKIKQFRWKVMDVAFADNLRNPRRLILEVNTNYPNHCYTTCGENGYGTGTHSDHSLRTLEEWLIWIDRFSDDLTGRELRECKEAARAPFTEPQVWQTWRTIGGKTSNSKLQTSGKPQAPNSKGPGRSLPFGEEEPRPAKERLEEAVAELEKAKSKGQATLVQILEDKVRMLQGQVKGEEG